MVNNVINHSEGIELSISVQRTYQCMEMVVSDNGVGIFNKIQREFGLDDPLHSLLELSKGKLTTDKSRHSGEGIAFKIYDPHVKDFSHELCGLKEAFSGSDCALVLADHDEFRFLYPGELAVPSALI